MWTMCFEAWGVNYLIGLYVPIEPCNHQQANCDHRQSKRNEEEGHNSINPGCSLLAARDGHQFANAGDSGNEHGGQVGKSAVECQRQRCFEQQGVENKPIPDQTQYHQKKAVHDSYQVRSQCHTRIRHIGYQKADYQAAEKEEETDKNEPISLFFLKWVLAAWMVWKVLHWRLPFQN
jgi:hypothetical protein